MDDIAANIVANYPEVLIPDRPIAFNRDLVKLGIGVKGALFLSQAIYWSKRTKNKDGWFYKTIEDWEDETGLTTDEQRGVKNSLIKEGYISVKKIGVPATNHFKVHLDVIAWSLLQCVRQSGEIPTTSGGESPAPVTGNSRDILYTENTHRLHQGEATSQEYEIVKDEEAKPRREKKFDPTPVFKLFRLNFPLNWNQNVTERKAAENLYKERGLEQVIKALDYYREHLDREFWPRINKPSDLDRKWQDLLDLKKKHGD